MIEQLATATDDELLAEVVALQATICREQYQQLAVLAELNARNVADVRGYRGLPQLIAEQIRCTAVEARKRVVAVERFGARRSVTGETLQPVYSATAEALAAGEVNPEHAAVIADTVEAIPAGDRSEHASKVEASLLEQARTRDPHELRLLGRRVLAHLDPDGPSPEEQGLQQVHRQVKLTGLDDATGLLHGRLSPTCRAIWETILTALATCRPDDVMGPDHRTIPQRWHDAFEEAGRRLLAIGDLPDHAGLPCQLVVTVSLTDLERRAGRATTQHGGTLSIAEALQLAAEATVPTPDPQRRRRHPRLRHRPPAGGNRPAQGPDRPRSWLHVPGLQPDGRSIRDSSRHRLGQRRPNGTPPRSHNATTCTTPNSSDRHPSSGCRRTDRPH